MSVHKALLIELFSIVWILYIGFVPQEWHGALSFGVLLAVVGILTASMRIATIHVQRPETERIELAYYWSC